MGFIYKKQYSEIAVLIHERKFSRAISIIHKERLQCYIAAIMNYYNGWELSDDSIYDFLVEYIDRGKLSYTIDKPKRREGHVLTDIQKELDKKIYPRRKEVTETLMRHFVLRLLKREKGKIKPSSELELFSFRSVNKFVLTQLKNGEIQVTNPDKFNDPFDCLVLSGIRKNRKLLKTEKRLSVNTYVKEMTRIRVGCFAGWDKKKKNPPYLNTLMWSHYANDHKGICIKYTISTHEPVLNEGISTRQSISRIDKVRYEANPVAKKEILSFSECFLVKDKVWNYENEYRLITYDSNQENNYITIPLSALGLKIEAIYFGLNCSQRNRSGIKKIFEGKGVELYSLDYDIESMNRITVVE